MGSYEEQILGATAYVKIEVTRLREFCALPGFRPTREGRIGRRLAIWVKQITEERIITSERGV